LPDDVVVSFGINGQQYNPDIKLNHKDLPNTYTYYDNPIINSYSPKRGPSSGGTLIKIAGFGFTPYRDDDGEVLPRPVLLRLRRFNQTGVTAPKEAEFVDNEHVHWETPPGEPESSHILELSLNGQDYSPVLMPKDNYSYEYYSSPRVVAIYPPYGPLESANPVTIFVKGTNFVCQEGKCARVMCRFGKGDEAIFVTGVHVSPTEIHCQAPKYNRPDVVPVEISLDGEYYTNDGKEFGFYDPFVWSVKPKIVSRRGNTTITIHGHGFVNTTGTYLKVRYGYPHKRLTCKGGPCIVNGTYIDKNTIKAQTVPYDEVVYERLGKAVGKDDFAVEVSVYGDDFTDNNASISYFADPTYGNPSPGQAAANGNETVLIPANFHTNASDPKNNDNDEEKLRKFGNATCRFTSLSGKSIEVQGMFLHYPLREGESLNAISCPSPEWDLPKDTEEETLLLDMSINGGADYLGRKLFKITERLEIYRLYPPCGPTHGKTRMKLVGTGFKQYQELHLKWGVLTSIFADKTSAESLIFKKGQPMSNDPSENEAISMNEDQALLFEQNRKYQTLESYSPRLPNWDRTHGGPVYLMLGKTTEFELHSNKHYQHHTYGPSFQEFYYYQQPVMKDMKPHGGPTTGGTQLVIRGSWFKYMPEYGVIPHVKIGDKISRCEFESTVRIICHSPANNFTASWLPVSVSLNGRDFTDPVARYHYYYPPLIKNINPKSGPESGGTRIRLYGERFTNLSSTSEFKCRFTAVDHKVPPKYIPAVYENETSIICRSPGGWSSGSKVNIEVTFNGEDYTNSGSIFYFYSILSAFPRSGPSDGTAGLLTIEGSGFRESPLVQCSFDGTRFRPVEVTWTTIKCKIPRAKHGDDFFGSVPLEVSINGVDYFIFDGGFHFYPQINVTDFYPRTGPAKGKGTIKFFGSHFRADFSLAKPACKFGPYIGAAEVMNSHEMLCHIPHIEAINQTYKGEAALNSHSFMPARSDADFVPYGILDIDPYSGPLGTQTQVTVYGEGFNRDGKAKCRFGVPGDYAILEGKVISSQRMLCMSPKHFDIIPKVMEVPFAVPISISFFDDKVNPWSAPKTGKKDGNATRETQFDPWTETGHVFRFYNQPVLIRITPRSCKVREIVDVYAYASPKTPFVERTSPLSSRSHNPHLQEGHGRRG
jgi:hypothetical protein